MAVTHPITIDDVPYKDAGTADNEAETLVTERFELAETLAQDQVDAAQVYLDSLSNLFATASMPESDISYEHQDITLDSDLNRPSTPDVTMGDVESPGRPDMTMTDVDKPDRPDMAMESITSPDRLDMTMADVDKPQKPSIDLITVPTISIPEYTLTDPSVGLVYAEPIYSSDLQNVLKLVLKDFVENGGTGLGATIEDALWARARARQDLLNERTYSEAEEYFASRGYTIPPGALGGRLTEALAERTRGDAQSNYEISIEQARLARAQSEYSLKAALELEGQDKEKFTAMANRTLEAAKAATQIIIDLFDVKMRAYIARMEGAKVSAEIVKVGVDAAAIVNESNVNVYRADLEAYKTEIQKEATKVESNVSAYRADIEGYKADIQKEIAVVETKVDVYKADIEAQKVQIQQEVATVESEVNVYKVDIEAYRAKVQQEIAIVEQIAKVYGFTVAGYEADVKVATADLDAQIKVYQGNIEQANNETTLTLREAEMTIQSYLGALQLTSDAIKEGGNISAQIAASALSAVNASASLGDTYSRAWDVKHGYSYGLSNRADLSETHRYDETAT